MKPLIILLAVITLCLSPAVAQTPAPSPDQFERLIQALERGTITANDNPNGALAVISVGLIAVVLLIVWRNKQQVDNVNPALAKVIAKYDERMDNQQQVIENQEDNQERFLKLMENLTSVQSSILELLKAHDQNSNGAVQQISTIELALKTLINQGSEPLREMITILKSIDARTKLMSETQLVNLQTIVEMFEHNLSEAVTDIKKTHSAIIQQLDIRRTDSRPVVPPET